MPDVSRELDAMEAASTLERAGLVRLCARLTGNPDAAEDLAHEALYEALRSAHKLHDPSGRSQWLAAIARNVCMRWARSRGRELARVPIARAGDDAAAPGVEALPDEGADLEVELERGELVEILDRALALLPQETREVLVRRYVHESPHAEIAERLGVTEKAVWARIGRGKLLLRRALETDLREEAIAYGLVAGDGSWGRETRIWCPHCGQRKLMGRFDKGKPEGRFHLFCPDCHPDPDFALSSTHVGYGHFRDLLEGVSSYRPALSRMLTWAHGYYTRGLEDGVVACVACGQATHVQMRLPDTVPPYARGLRGLHVKCDDCASVVCIEGLPNLALSLPEARRFWREHPRIRTLPTREVEMDGCAAVVTMFESVTGSAQLAVVMSRKTLRPLGAHSDADTGA